MASWLPCQSDQRLKSNGDTDRAAQVLGEYGLTNVLMSHGYNVATLMARYRPVRPCGTLTTNTINE